MRTHVPLFEGALGDRWKTAPLGGEMAFSINPTMNVPRFASNPTEAVADHAEQLVRYIRRWHWTALGWVSGYKTNVPGAAEGAARVQAAFGYRFVIREASFPPGVQPGGKLPLTLKVQNTGSAPIYYDWPIEVSLLDPNSRQPVWKG